jgi:transcriptional regulator with XRE-family HTH domain
VERHLSEATDGRVRTSLARVRERCAALGMSVEDTAEAIHAECGVSRLRAWRVARSLKLQEMAALMKEQGRQANRPLASLTHQRISAWERGEDQPSPRYLDALCRLFSTRPDKLGFGEDYGPLSAALADAPSATAHQLRGAAELRASTMGILIPSARSASMVAQLEDSVERLGLGYRKMPTKVYLDQVLTAYREATLLLHERRGLRAQARILRSVGQLAGVIGVLMIDLGDGLEAREWFIQGCRAVYETGDRALLGWILTRQAMVDFYYGTPADANRTASFAVAAAEGTRGIASSMAPAVLARTRSRAGDHEGAMRSMIAAKRAYDAAASATLGSGLYAFSEAKLAFYEGEVYSRSARGQQALAAQDLALRLYGASERIDPALVKVSRARTLIRSGDLEAAADIIRNELQSLSHLEVRGTVAAAVRDVLSVVPDQRHASRAFGDIYELLVERENNPD